jgi:hypothetical protein
MLCRKGGGIRLRITIILARIRVSGKWETGRAVIRDSAEEYRKHRVNH